MLRTHEGKQVLSVSEWVKVEIIEELHENIEKILKNEIGINKIQKNRVFYTSFIAMLLSDNVFLLCRP